MFRLIVVPLDGSPFGERALPLAMRIARHTGSALELVHVYRAADYAGLAARHERLLDDELRVKMRDSLVSLAERVAAESGLAVTATFLEGDVVPTLEAHVAARGADLVVMTTHGRGGVSRAWLGSVADALVRELGVPVLLARPSTVGRGGVKAPPVRRVLVPLDGSALAEEVLVPALSLNTPYRTEYLLLRVVPPILASLPQEIGAETLAADIEWRQQEAVRYLSNVAERIRRPGIVVNVLVIVSSPAANAILDVARDRRVDLIALSTRGPGALGRLLLGSVADKVIRGATMPTLVYRPPAVTTTENVSEAADLPSTGDRVSGTIPMVDERGLTQG